MHAEAIVGGGVGRSGVVAAGAHAGTHSTRSAQAVQERAPASRGNADRMTPTYGVEVRTTGRFEVVAEIDMERDRETPGDSAATLDA